MQWERLPIEHPQVASSNALSKAGGASRIPHALHPIVIGSFSNRLGDLRCRHREPLPLERVRLALRNLLHEELDENLSPSPQWGSYAQLGPQHPVVLPVEFLVRRIGRELVCPFLMRG